MLGIARASSRHCTCKLMKGKLPEGDKFRDVESIGYRVRRFHRISRQPKAPGNGTSGTWDR